MKVNRSYRAIYGILIALLLLFSFLNLRLGSLLIPIEQLFAALIGREAPEVVKSILWLHRVPKMVTALLAGASLSICGLQMQTLFRNPLADPFILGISSGAGLGVALFTMGFSVFGITLTNGLAANIGIISAAWIGAASVTLLILLLSKRLKDNLSLLIFGIMVASITSALISLIQYFSTATNLKVFVMWTMGSFSGLSPLKITIMAIPIAVGLLLSLYNIKDLNVLLLGENYAKSLGVNLERSKRRILIATTLLAGSVTAFCGPIGFIGIAVPHIARMLFRNANHKILLPSTALLGATLMLFADTLAQLPGQSHLLPINSVSALIGVPFIFYIILKEKSI